MAKLDEFIAHFTKANYAAFMLNSQGEFLDEFTPDHLNRLKELTNFSGSNGIAIISKDHQVFFTDGRYLTQAKQQLDQRFKIYDLHQESITQWIINNIDPNSRIAYDSRSFTSSKIIKLSKTLQEYNIKLYHLSKSPITMQQPQNESEITIFTKEFAGLDHKEKIKQNKLLNILTGKQSFFTCDTASICWLLNIRGADVPYTPLIHAYFIYNKRSSLLFCNPKKITNKLANYFKELNVKIIDIAKISDFGNICKEHKIKQIFLDPNYVTLAFILLV